jgi:hypothetical protein
VNATDASPEDIETAIGARPARQLDDEVHAAGEEQKKRELVEERVVLSRVPERRVPQADDQRGEVDEPKEVDGLHAPAEHDRGIVEKEARAARYQDEDQYGERRGAAEPSYGDRERGSSPGFPEPFPIASIARARVPRTVHQGTGVEENRPLDLGANRFRLFELQAHRRVGVCAGEEGQEKVRPEVSA